MNKLTLPISISNLVEKIGKRQSFEPEEIIEIITQSNISEKELLDWADFKHPKSEGYGRKVIYQCDHFEILVMSWAPNDFTAIHNHGYTEWGAVQCFGKLEQTTFELNEGILSTLFKEKIHANEIFAVNQDLIHQMGNPYDTNAISLHVYGTSKKVKNVTENSLLFEVGKNQIQLVSGGVIYDLPEKEITVMNRDLHADRLTLIGHYSQLLNFYLKTGKKGPQYQSAVNYFLDRSFESRLISELEMDSKEVLYMIELKKAKLLLAAHGESTNTINSILSEINDPDNFS